jgi:hypothetical protein
METIAEASDILSAPEAAGAKQREFTEIPAQVFKHFEKG